MGIPRLTQDLQPYLENATLSGDEADGSILIQALVIDGPSMVYHVYNRLQSHCLAQGDGSKIDMPTYSLLNLATQQFLHDIEARGVKISKIFFDGALPKSKRQTRADRLEKSRRALEVYRAAYPSLNLGQSESSREVSQALWPSQPRTVSTEFAAPFIVPSVLEYLRSSKWSDIVSVVPGEADSYCAYEAQQEQAAVLTNDSDLVLFDGVEVVVILNSLTINQHDQVQVNCWRPRRIAEQFGIQDLSSLGFARASNPKASFNAVAQMAKETEHNDEFQSFKAEFESHSSGLSSNVLDSFDPRSAEVVCQLSGPNPERKPEMTQPMLLEDLNRDASWSYGKDIRRLAYSILVKHFTSLRSIEVVEYSRKGPAVTATVFTILSKSDLEQYAQELLDRLSRYSLDTPRSWIIYALHEVWSQRNNAGRSVFSAHILSILLGLAPLPISGQKTINMWDVLHLNANIQAVLYSVRLLKQAIGLKERLEDMKFLAEKLQQMLTMEQIFLTPYETREDFRKLPRKELKGLLQPFLIDFAMAGILGMDGPQGKTAQNALRRSAHDKPQHEEFLVAKRKRRRGNKHGAKDIDTTATRQGGQNMYEVLSGSVP